MLKGMIAGIALTLGVIAIVGYVMIQTGAVPANADERPPSLERWAARTSLGATINRSAPRQDNPLAATDENIIAGIKLYGQNCAMCHGDSSAHPTNVAKGLYQHPPQLAKRGVEDDPAGETYWKVTHGIRWTGMPSFGKTLNQTQLWQVTLFFKEHGSPVAGGPSSLATD